MTAEPGVEALIARAAAAEEAALAVPGVNNSEGSDASFGRGDIHLVTTAQVTDAQFDRNLRLVRNAMAGLDLQEADAMRIQSSVQALVLGWAVVARGPYAGQLAPVLDFERLVRENVDMLIEGEARKLSRGQEES